ncbi:MAG: metalloregulator ArsR/SmtB family transcription factor [Phycisphaerales bacterium]|nr:metalloregulator ArsR/SmtB family transcription factor [Phycisphaerales bacterium]
MKPGAALSPIIERIAMLSEPARFRALCVLEREELSVGELSRVLQAPQSTVSRHLKLLAGAGWVRSRTERTATYHRLSLDDLAESDRALWKLLREQVDGRGEVAADARRLAEVLAERQTDSLTFFGRVAGEWDAVRHDLFGDRFTSEALLSLIRPNWVVADVGCGTGNVASLLAPVVERVIAVDQSGPMLEAARQRLAGADNVTFEQGAVEALPIETGSVDAAVCALVLHHVDDVEAACAELSRVLRSDRGGGVALVIDMYAHERAEYRLQMGHRHLGFDPAEVSSLLLAAGFGSTLVRALACGGSARGPGLFAISAWK